MLQQICGHILTDNSGIIRSPDLDEDGYYDDMVECSWIIVAADNQLIELQVLAVSLEHNFDNDNNIICPYDYVKVFAF